MTTATAPTLGLVAPRLSERSMIGLSTSEAARVMKERGPNELVRTRGPSPARIFAAQCKGAMVWLLVGATAISAFVGERTDAIAIAVILVLNAVVGFLQEFRAERAVQALKKMTAPRARVVRDGTDCALTLAVGLIPVTTIELSELARRARQRRRSSA